MYNFYYFFSSFFDFSNKLNLISSAFDYIWPGKNVYIIFSFRLRTFTTRGMKMLKLMS